MEQIRAKLRVGHADQGQSAFLNAFAVQISDAEFGHDVMHARPGRNHTCALAQVSHDTRDGAPLSGRRQGDDGFAAARLGCAAVEVDLAADSGEELGPDGIGANLAGQIHLQGSVHRHHFVLLANNERVVDVFGRVKREERGCCRCNRKAAGSPGRNWPRPCRGPSSCALQ